MNRPPTAPVLQQRPAPPHTARSGLRTVRSPATAAAPRTEEQRDTSSPSSARQDRSAIRAAGRGRRRFESAELRRPRAGFRTRRVAATAAVVAALLVAVPAILAFGPVFPVRTISVSGASTALAAQVRSALAPELGRPVALVGDADVAAALRSVPAVERFTLVRRPPETLEVAVVPRTAIAQQRIDGRWAVVDAAHVVIGRSATADPSLPIVVVPDGTLRPAASFAAAAAALDALAGSSPVVVGVRAGGADDVVVTLASGLRVRWGGSDDGAAKAQALHAALRTAAATATEVDVSSPGVVLTR